MDQNSGRLVLGAAHAQHVSTRFLFQEQELVYKQARTTLRYPQRPALYGSCLHVAEGVSNQDAATETLYGQCSSFNGRDETKKDFVGWGDSTNELPPKRVDNASQPRDKLQRLSDRVGHQSYKSTTIRVQGLWWS
jgi:hypothetical protein